MDRGGSGWHLLPALGWEEVFGHNQTAGAPSRRTNLWPGWAGNGQNAALLKKRGRKGVRGSSPALGTTRSTAGAPPKRIPFGTISWGHAFRQARRSGPEVIIRITPMAGRFQRKSPGADELSLRAVMPGRPPVSSGGS